MSDESFKYPPGITTVQEWCARIAIRPGDVEAIQQDAVSAARRELQGLDVLAANNAAHKDKICRCVFAPWHQQTTYKYGGVRICGYCDRPIL